jgi:uncharacterized protein
MGSDELICLSMDFPHRDFDSPLEALPVGLPDDLVRTIFSENAPRDLPPPARVMGVGEPTGARG